jgi:myo-inositol-1(or 4)-monophosphatase
MNNDNVPSQSATGRQPGKRTLRSRSKNEHNAMNSLRPFITELAKAGGAIARQYFQNLSAADVQIKADRDYVSRADSLVEAEIIRRIRQQFPAHSILGEESGAGGQTLNAQALWIIDPIDGTTNFIHGIAMFAVSIAFCDEQGPHTAVVYDPIADELFFAERGQGLWLNNQRRTTSGCTQLRHALIATAMPFRSPAVHEEALAVFSQLQQACDDQRRAGAASLDLAYVAVGRLDAYYELGIHPWDTAAGELLVRCGGGIATDYRGNSQQILARRSIVAASHLSVHQAILKAVAPLVPWLDRPPFVAA